MIEDFKRDWYWHVAFWLIYMMIKIWVVEFFRDNLWVILGVELISLPLKMAASYFLVYFLVPKYLLLGKYIKFFVGLVIATAIVAFLRRVTDVFFVYPIIVLYSDDIEFWNVWAMFRNLIYIYPVVGLGSAMFFTAHWVRDYKSRMELAQQKLNAELQLLKAQVHPHFLFNTINNIYSLALDQSKKVPDALLGLSDLLSYMIYECNVAKIDLSKEIEQLNNYINLEKLRYGNRLDFSFDQHGKSNGVMIAPLILLPFIDNAFKHGAGNAIDQCQITISLKVHEDELIFNIENSVHEVLKTKGGIGLSNVQKRLAMEYPDQHELIIEKSDEWFEVNLKLNL